MKKIINLNKPIGLTPLQAINLFKKNNPEYKDTKVGYAGRLDPMANGILLLLIEDENKKFTEYSKLDKEYLAEILLGFKSDTYDILGIAKKTDNKKLNSKSTTEEIKQALNEIKKTKFQKLPPYSSYIIDKKPLFWYARNNKLKDIKIPTNKIEIKEIKLKSIKKIQEKELLKTILSKINLVNGNFRQEEINKKWGEILSDNNKEYPIIKINIRSSSGTYIRSIADELNGVLFNLSRIKLGKFKINQSISLN